MGLFAMQAQEHIALHGIVRVRKMRKVLGLFELEVRSCLKFEAGSCSGSSAAAAAAAAAVKQQDKLLEQQSNVNSSMCMLWLFSRLMV
jgi:mevalonate pyrophosphate decarboxylase